MKRAVPSAISDGHLDRELATFLDQLGGELSGAPSVEEMRARLIDRSMISMHPNRAYAWRRFALLMALVALTLAALATMLVVGLSRPTDDALGNGPIIVAGVAYDPFTGELGPDPCNCTTDAIWSADGTRVAFRRSTKIFVTDLAEGWERKLAECTDCDEPLDHISISADGSAVAFTDAGDVWLVDVDTGIRTRVTELGDGRQARSPTLAPESDRLAFVVEREPGVWVVDVDGGDPWQLISDVRATDLAWSPDGDSIAYLDNHPVSGRPDPVGMQLWTVDPASAEQRRLWNWPDCCVRAWGGPVWSPDGQELALVATDRGRPQPTGQWMLWVVAADGSTARSLAVAKPVRPAWRPVPLSEPLPSAADVQADVTAPPP